MHLRNTCLNCGHFIDGTWQCACRDWINPGGAYDKIWAEVAELWHKQMSCADGRSQKNG